jgi:hypothetical protein
MESGASPTWSDAAAHPGLYSNELDAFDASNLDFDYSNFNMTIPDQWNNPKANIDLSLYQDLGTAPLSGCSTPEFGSVSSSPSTYSFSNDWRANLSTTSQSPTTYYSTPSGSPRGSGTSTPLHISPSQLSSPCGTQAVDYFSATPGAQHDCLAQASNILIELQQPQKVQRPTSSSRSRSKSNTVPELVTNSRLSLRKAMNILDCHCVNWDHRLALCIASICQEILSSYTNLARVFLQGGGRLVGRIRARLGMILGELPSIARLIERLSGLWQMVGHASDHAGAGQEQVAKLTLAFNQLAKDLRRRLRNQQ